jgi:hypothetical protein
VSRPAPCSGCSHIAGRYATDICFFLLVSERSHALSSEYTGLLDKLDQESIPRYDERGEDDQGVEEAVFRRESIFAFHDTTPLR